MNEAHEALIRDIARLFLKYGLEEWKAVILLLQRGGPDHALIAKAIVDLQAKVTQRPTRAKPTRSDKRAAFELPPDRAEVLGELAQAMEKRELLPSAASFREIFVRAGGKGILPKKRDAAIRMLVEHLAALPNDAYSLAMREIAVSKGVSGGDMRREYSRWFSLIYDKNEQTG